MPCNHNAASAAVSTALVAIAVVLSLYAVQSAAVKIEGPPARRASSPAMPRERALSWLRTAGTRFEQAGSTCPQSDAQMSILRQTLCRSLVGPTTPWCESDKDIKAHGDWPSQTAYFYELVAFLENSAASCLNTSYAADTLSWFNGPLSDPSVSGSYAWTWEIFQVQYYAMPRPAGERIESPWTLGEKCWAFTALQQRVDLAPLATRAATVGATIANATAMYTYSAPLTMQLCREVMANCFLNESYDPSRKGTCPLSVDEFKGGWDWENLKFGSKVTYPF